MLQELHESKVEADRLRRANEASEERLASLSSSAKCSRWQRLVQILCTVKASHRCLLLEWVHIKLVFAKPAGVSMFIGHCLDGVFFQDLTVFKLRKQFVADQELDQAREEVHEQDAASLLHHGVMSQLSQDHLDWRKLKASH